MKIVIVTYNWPPRNAIGTHRPYAWARYWSEAGAEVIVLTAQKQQFDAPLDLALPEIGKVDVIEIPYGSVTGLVSRILKSERLRRLIRKLKFWLKQKGGLTIDPRSAWRKAAKSVAMRLAKDADIVVSTFGPAAAHLIANDMKLANAELLWIADYRDLWSQNHISSFAVSERAEARHMELASVGKNADLLTAVSDDMVQKLKELTGISALHIPNGFDIDEQILRLRLETGQRRPELPLRFVHTGMLYEGHRDPTPLLDALVALRATGKLSANMVSVDFYGARIDVARRLAKKPDYAPFIRLMGHVPRDQALAAQQDADILLLLESPAPEARGVLTGKLFEYIASGRPILCIGSRPDYEIGKVLSKTRTGSVFGPDDYERLAVKLTETLEGTGLFLEYAPEIEEILRYSRKRLAREMLQAITRLPHVEVVQV